MTEFTPSFYIVEIHRKIDKFHRKDGELLEIGLRDGIFLAKAAKLQRIMSAVSRDIIDDQIIVSNQITLLGMIPKVAGILDELTLR